MVEKGVACAATNSFLASSVARIQFIGMGQFGRLSWLLVVSSLVEAFVLMGALAGRDAPRMPVVDPLLAEFLGEPPIAREHPYIPMDSFCTIQSPVALRQVITCILAIVWCGIS